MMTLELTKELEEALGDKILSVAPLSAANDAQIYRLGCEKKYYVAKVSNHNLDIESWMLKYLHDKASLPIPHIYYSTPYVLMMDYVESQFTLDPAAQQDAARHLARLHQIRGDSFGLERDTLIGALDQPNTQTADWIDFFINHRLLYMAEKALKEEKIDTRIMTLIEKLCGKIGQYIGQPPYPALIHGDIWSGNILSVRGRIAAFIDPAIYYADSEMELAFIQLFNTFDENFFQTYNDILPIRAGFETRVSLYNIYPLLVHARLFGVSYTRKVVKLLEKFV